MAKESYVIEAGSTERPESIQRGTIEKGTGQTVLAGETVPTLLKRADIGIPNVSQAWGVRLNKEGKIPDEPLDIKSSDYKGQIQELKWGHPQGCLIICRFLKGYNSIDMLYQDTVLNAKANIDESRAGSEDAYYLRLQSGDNFFDPETDKYLCQMLRVHYLNGSSVYRSPEAQQQMFVERDGEITEQRGTVLFNAQFEAMKVVNEASQDNSLAKLKNLLAIVNVIGTEEPRDADLFRYLGFLAQTKPEAFLSKIQEYKRVVSDLFEKAKSYKAIDLTKNGVIAAGVEKVELIAEGIPAKGDGMIDWIMQNYLDAKAADTIIKLTQITDKLN